MIYENTNNCDYNIFPGVAQSLGLGNVTPVYGLVVFAPNCIAPHRDRQRNMKQSPVPLREINIFKTNRAYRTATRLRRLSDDASHSD